MNRSTRRADIARFRRESCGSLVTFLVDVGDSLNDAPLLRNTARHWFARLPTTVRHCIICDAILLGRPDVGALLFSTPATDTPTTASIVAICAECWDGQPLEAIEREAERTLQVVVPGGRLEPLASRHLLR